MIRLVRRVACDHSNNGKLGGDGFEKVEKFKYLGETVSIKNDWSKLINIRINKAEKTEISKNKKCSQEDSKRDCICQL